jgi:hypothetical protein
VICEMWGLAMVLTRLSHSNAWPGTDSNIYIIINEPKPNKYEVEIHFVILLVSSKRLASLLVLTVCSLGLTEGLGI